MKSHPGGEAHTRRMLELAGLPEGARVLDMGAGVGDALAILRDQGFDPADKAPGTEARVLAADERRRLREAIAALPEEQREALVLTQLEGVSYAEAAGITGVSEGTVKSRINRAREKLKELLAEERELSPPGTVQQKERRRRS